MTEKVDKWLRRRTGDACCSSRLDAMIGFDRCDVLEGKVASVGVVEENLNLRRSVSIDRR